MFCDACNFGMKAVKIAAASYFVQNFALFDLVWSLEINFDKAFKDLKYEPLVILLVFPSKFIDQNFVHSVSLNYI